MTETYNLARQKQGWTISIETLIDFLEDEFKEQAISLTILTDADNKLNTWIILHEFENPNDLTVHYEHGKPVFYISPNKRVNPKEFLALIHADTFDLSAIYAEHNIADNPPIHMISNKAYASLVKHLDTAEIDDILIDLLAIARGYTLFYGNPLPTESYKRLLPLATPPNKQATKQPTK